MTPVTIYANKGNSRFSGYRNCIVYGYSKVSFLSVVLSRSQADGLLFYFNRHQPLTVDSYSFSKNDTEYYRSNGRDGYVHLVFKARICNLARTEKDYAYAVDGVVFCSGENDDESAGAINEALRSAQSMRLPSKFVESVYELLAAQTTLPIMKEWTEYIIRNVEPYNFWLANTSIDAESDPAPFGFTGAINVRISDSDLREVIQKGLARKEISIDDCNDCSVKTKTLTGLDSYLDAFGQVLADYTTEKFKPIFDPSKEKVSQKVHDFFTVCQYYTPRIVSYEVQKHIMEAGVRHLDHGDNFLISAQTGTGKTIMGIGTVACHARKPNYSVIVMVPPKLTERWRRGIEAVVPMAEVRIASSTEDIIECGKIAKNPLRMRSLWVIITESAAKINYEEHPAVVWSKSKNCYVCPHCGKPIAIGHNRNLSGGEESRYNTTSIDFLKQGKENTFCKNVIGSHGIVTNGCGAKLWTAATESNSKSWVKIKDMGWVQKDRIDTIKSTLEYLVEHLVEDAPVKDFRNKYAKLINAIDTHKAKGSATGYTKRYAMAHYIRKHLNHVFDYLIADEVHQLAKASERGNAFGIIANSVWKSVFLTGTLSNGKADGLFHMLFRTKTKDMLDRGFELDDKGIKQFCETYGVVEKKTVRRGHYDTRGRSRRFVLDTRGKTSRLRALPGVSPTLVTDFLMNDMVSASKRDIKPDLCDYTEHPVAVNMSQALAESYGKILTPIVEEKPNGHGSIQLGYIKAVKSAVQTANLFLEQPYGLEIDDGHGNLIENLDLNPKTIFPKEQKLIELALQKKEEGEKMLIFCEYVEKIDIVKRLVKLLNEAGVKTVNMGNNVKQTEREDWLVQQAEEGIDAVVLNPARVDVGLNLLDYTSIIFYEIGNNVTTIRQASQRSNRINQTDPVSVYFMYYAGTIQEDTLGAISQKLKASKAVEGDFNQSALEEMTDDTDILSKVVNSIVKNEHIEVKSDNFAGQAEEEKRRKREAEEAKAKENGETVHADVLSCFADRKIFNFMEPSYDEYAPMIA